MNRWREAKDMAWVHAVKAEAALQELETGRTFQGEENARDTLDCSVRLATMWAAVADSLRPPV